MIGFALAIIVVVLLVAALWNLPVPKLEETRTLLAGRTREEERQEERQERGQRRQEIRQALEYQDYVPLLARLYGKPTETQIPLTESEMTILVEQQGDGNCPVCQEKISTSWSCCPICNTPHHNECWSYNEKKCSTYGCNGRLKENQ